MEVTNDKGIHLALMLCLFISIVWLFVPHPIVALAIGLVPIGLLYAMSQPFLMVLLFVVFSFFRLHEVFPQIYALKIPLLLSLASLAALLWHMGISKKIKPYWCHELTILTLFFSLVLIGVFLASNRPIAINYFKGIYWKIALMTFAIAWLTQKPKDFALASIMIVISGTLVALVALYNKMNGIGMVEETRVTIGRTIGSVLGDPNDLALVLMFPVAFAVSLIVTKNLNKGYFYLGIMSVPLLFSAIIATQSRGGLLGVMTVLGIFAWRKIESKALVISLALLGALLLFAAAGISDRASGGATEDGLDASAKGRLYAWEAAFSMAVERPFTGVGLDNFYSNYYYYSPHWDGLNHAVHSTWFGVLAETGFLGLFVFITLIIVLVKSSSNSIKTIETNLLQVPPVIYATSQALLAGLLGTIVSGTFLTQGFTWPIYILAAIVVALSHWVKKTKL